MVGIVVAEKHKEMICEQYLALFSRRSLSHPSNRGNKIGLSS